MNDDLRGIAAGVVACVGRAAWVLPDAVLIERLTLVERVLRQLDAVRLAIVRELDGRDLAHREGATSLGAWLRARFQMSISTANRLVRLAKAVDADLPATGKAVAAGVVSMEQAWEIKRAVEALPDKLEPEVVAEAEAALVEHAERLDPAALRMVGERILQHVAPEVAEEHERRRLERQSQEAWQRRRLTFTPDGEGGVRISGLLDVESAALVQAGIDALAAPRNRRRADRPVSAGGGGEFEPDARGSSGDGSSCSADPDGRGARPASSRLAGSGAAGSGAAGSGAAGSGAGGSVGSVSGCACSCAFGVDASGVAGAAGADGSGVAGGAGGAAGGAYRGGVHGSGGWDERTVAQRRADALREVFGVAFGSGELPDHGGDRPSVVVTVAYDPLTRQLGIGTTDSGERLAPDVVRRLACDAKLLPAVLDGRGQPLDLGRERRLFTGALRRALVLRDGGCSFPGCDRPPKWCEGHHVRPWDQGGPTRPDNGCLLCSYHHHVIHDGDWQVRIAADGRPEFIPPAWVDHERRPQRNHQLRRAPTPATAGGSG